MFGHSQLSKNKLTGMQETHDCGMIEALFEIIKVIDTDAHPKEIICTWICFQFNQELRIYKEVV